VELTASHLEAAGLGRQLDAIEDAVETHLEGSHANVAVVAEPYAGRDVLLSKGEAHLGAAAGHVAFEEPVTDPETLEFPNREVVFVEGCHYLYERRVDGFDALDAFVERTAEADALFVTAWNRWAWDYVAAVRDVDRAFPETVEVPRLDAEAITALVQEHVDERPSFVESGDYGRVKTVDVDTTTVGSVAGRDVRVPVPEFNVEYLTAQDLGDEYGDVERVVYERLARLSEGNPGVALALWADAARDGELSAAELDERDAPLELDDDEAFALTTVLCKERLSFDALDRLLDDVDVALAVQTLAYHDLVTVEDGVVSVTPERFHAAVEHLEGRRYLW
jgi:hypothetical protein